MNLKRQLLLVSLLTLVLPWAGCQFIRESESALRAGQQQMLSGTARAIADTLAQYPEEFPGTAADQAVAEQIYGHRLETRPEIDGYIDDWPIGRDSLVALRGTDGPIHFVVGVADEAMYLYVRVSDRNVVYTRPESVALQGVSRFSDRITLTSLSPPYLEETLVFAAEAPGVLPVFVRNAFGFAPDPTIRAHWQDVPGGYQVEARIPLGKVGTHLGLTVSNTSDASEAPARSASFSQTPGAFVRSSPELIAQAELRVRAGSGMRLIVTDAAGWRIAQSGSLATAQSQDNGAGAIWMRRIYDMLVESGSEAALAEPDASGYEDQPYIVSARQGEESVAWFRSPDSGRAVVAAAQPVRSGGEIIGAIVLQQGTEAILSLTNETLGRLITVTLIATIVVAATLLGYATWLSRRIRGLSRAAEAALESDELRMALPSATAGDEIGDLSRGFSNVLRQLGDYNDYLRSLASKLSHELRTPLAIVTSSLENLEHEPLNEASKEYANRARDGAERLRRILTAMSEASRVEELMKNAELEAFDLCVALRSTVDAYRDVYSNRQFTFVTDLESVIVNGSPELVIQMLDKLVDNAVDFSSDDDTITITLDKSGNAMTVGVHNPGPPLPDRMRSQLFDSMVSMRPQEDNKHLGLGLYVARLIAEGHGGRIDAENTHDGVAVTVVLPANINGDGHHS